MALDIDRFRVEVPWPKKDLPGKFNHYRVVKITTTKDITRYVSFGEESHGKEKRRQG